MSEFKPEKLHVTLDPTLDPHALTPRRDTLTHSDQTGDLFLTVAPAYDRGQISGWYTRLMRDEVLGEWLDAEGRPELHIHLHVSGGLIFGTAGMRDRIFPHHLPLALRVLVYGDRDLIAAQERPLDAPLIVHFHARQDKWDRVEDWGKVRGYSRSHSLRSGTL